ncbi:MAG: AAA family ATPase, partial [Clostridia bacterium]
MSDIRKQSNESSSTEMSLRSVIQSNEWDLPDKLRIAAILAERVGDLHRKQLVLKSLQPDNIWVDDAKMQVRIIPTKEQFGPDSNEQTSLRTALPYLSPEMTGRLGRTVDYRTDLYSLGIILYEFLTGWLPFEANDPIEWTHAHIAKLPLPLTHFDPQLPVMVEKIVLKLLDKNVGDRYQSANGLKADLEYCLSMLKERGSISEFPLGQKDSSRIFEIVDGVYGRDQEISQVRDAFHWACLGSTELVFISGPAGIGKTALVQEIQRMLAREKGYFITGKFEQFNREVPYATVIGAFRELIQQILMESKERISRVKEQLHHTVGANLAMIVDVLPELKLVVGEVPPLELLSSAELQHRFLLAFRSFVQVFAKKEHPLLFFLDDLQWADTASLQMIHSFLTDPESGNLLIIGAFRDNEVNSGHPLLLKLEEIKEAGVRVHSLPLMPLTMHDLNQMTAATLKCEESSSLELTEQLYQKTAGNPFFFKQLLQTVYVERMIAFDADRGMWKWDLAAIKRKKTTDDLLDFMVNKIRKLPERTQSVLSLAACLGSRFDLKLLADVQNSSVIQLEADLVTAVQEGFVIALDASTYSFLHDRIQQAAASLLDEDEKHRFHGNVGSYLLAKRVDGMVDLFDLVTHLNLGVGYMEQPPQLVELNLEAGRKAKSSSAYDAAAIYFRAGASLLTAADWEMRFDLCFALCLERTECEYLNGQFEQAEQLAIDLIQRSRNRLDRAAACRVIATQYVNLGKYTEAITLGLRLLAEFDISIPLHPKKTDITKEMLLARWHIRNQADRLLTLPEMKDQDILAIIDLMATLAAPSFFSNKEVFIMLMSRSVRLTLKYGMSPVSATGCAAYAMFLGLVMGDYENGYRLGKIALQLSDRYNIGSVKCKTYVMFGSVISNWLKHFKEGEAYLEQALQFGLESGDYVFASYAMGGHINLLYVRKSLAELERWIAHYMEVLAETKDEFVIDNFVLYQQWIRAMRGETESLESFNTEQFREELFMQQVGNKEFIATTLFQFYTYKAQLHYLNGQYEQALEACKAAKPHTKYATHLPHLAECCFYESLAVAAVLQDGGERANLKLYRHLKRNLGRLQAWAKHAPDNYAHNVLLIEAEIARLSKNDSEAMKLYERAIQAAQKSDFIPIIGIAAERAASFYKEKEIASVAQLYADKAYTTYSQWGATVLAERVRRSFPRMETDAANQVASAAQENRSFAPYQPEPADPNNAEHAALDLATILKASQTVSEELDLQQLLARLMGLIIENAGAQHGCLVIEGKDGFVVEVAMGTVEGVRTESVSLLQQPIAAESILRYVWRTAEVMILPDAQEEALVANDPYVLARHPRSILCTPVLVQGELKGILYLENNLTTHAFTEERLDVLQMLSAQVIYVKRLLHSFGDTTISVQSTEQTPAEGLVEPLTEREIEVLNLMA